MKALRAKVAVIAGKYADYLDHRIDAASGSEFKERETLIEEIRILGHLVATLERLDRSCCGSSVSDPDGERA